MKSAVECLKTLSRSGKPWLVTGKGPTFDSIRNLTLSRFNTLALNHTCMQYLPDVVHFIDYDAWDGCADVLLDPADTAMVIIAWHPHVNFVASPKTLEQFLAEDTRLQRVYEQGRLFSYNSTTWGGPHNKQLPKIPVRNFSATAAVALLLQAGVRTINTLGIDGGHSYSQVFNDLNTCLANGQDSFDSQMPFIEELVRRHDAQWCRNPEDVLPVS